ncbi:MAG: metallophosphoesterase [Promethearchaeota archaeon]
MNKKKMKLNNFNLKFTLLNKFVNAGINITPNMLDFILSLKEPKKKADLIIKFSSFIPTFKSHITENILKKISNKEIQKAFKRKIIKENFNLAKNESKSFKKKIINSSSNLNNSKVDDLKVSNKSFENEILKKQKPKLDKFERVNNFKNFSKINQKKRINIKKYESTKSSFTFNPIAKEYSSIYEILKDPTGKIHTNGDYEDFYELTVDKFNQLKILMKKRPEVLSAMNVNTIFRNSQNQYISIVGLVNEIRQTKRGNYFVTIEDLTGSINVIVKREVENTENRKIIERTTVDQMLFIEGTYNPGKNGKKGIIFAENISKIDIPSKEINRSKEPLSIALISDTHIGSKEFEEKLFLKFINFLKGKGNKKLREIAGRIKYIVINGDLVDGIGVYPTQEEDLIISNIYKQYKKAAELLSEIPEYIKIFYSSGNHEPVRNALPRPSVPKKYTEELIDIGIQCIGNPSHIKTHNVSTLIFHGDSMLDLNLLIPSLDNKKPVETMKELLICRHLVPVYGKKTQIAPTNKDWLVIDKIPNIFHTGHIHINGIGQYKNVFLANSGCFQSQTEFMKSFGITPTPGIVPIIELDSYKSIELDFKIIN